MFYIQGSFWDGPQFKVSLFCIYEEEKKPRDKYDYLDMKWNNTHATKERGRNMHRHHIKVGHFLALSKSSWSKILTEVNKLNVKNYNKRFNYLAKRCEK